MQIFKDFHLSDRSPVVRKIIVHKLASEGMCSDTFQIPILVCEAATASCLNYSSIHF